VRIINCARGGLVDEAALQGGARVGPCRRGGASTSFETEPATENPLFNLPNVVCTPHLGAATTEAQENVALQVAEQMSDYLLHGAVSNALNMPSITAEEAPRLKPFVAACRRARVVCRPAHRKPIKEIDHRVCRRGARDERQGADVGAAGRPDAADAGRRQHGLGADHGEGAGIKVDEVRATKTGVYENYIRLIVKTERQERSVAGTVFSDGKPRIIQIKGINMEAELGRRCSTSPMRTSPASSARWARLLGDAA
jgi:D-3-phosphoglycerate dehydrogenase